MIGIGTCVFGRSGDLRPQKEGQISWKGDVLPIPSSVAKLSLGVCVHVAEGRKVFDKGSLPAHEHIAARVTAILYTPECHDR